MKLPDESLGDRFVLVVVVVTLALLALGVVT